MNRPVDCWTMFDACYWMPWYTRGPQQWNDRDRAAADRVIAAAEAVGDHDPDRAAELLTTSGDVNHCSRVGVYFLAIALSSSPDRTGLMDMLVAETTTAATLVITSETLELAAELARHLVDEADVPIEDTELHRLLNSGRGNVATASVTAAGLLALIWSHYPDDAAFRSMRQTYGSGVSA